MASGKNEKIIINIPTNVLFLNGTLKKIQAIIARKTKTKLDGSLASPNARAIDNM